MAPFPLRNISVSPTLSGFAGYEWEKGLELFWKEAEIKRPVYVKILPSTPHHARQERRNEIKDITERFDQLKCQYGDKSVVGVYLQGGPAIGKAYLAREFGEKHYETLINSYKFGRTSGKIAVVATLDARTPGGFLRSYLCLAEDIGLPVKRYSAASSNLREQVAIISNDVRLKLTETAPDWLLIITGLDAHCKLFDSNFDRSLSCMCFIPHAL